MVKEEKKRRREGGGEEKVEKGFFLRERKITLSRADGERDATPL